MSDLSQLATSQADEVLARSVEQAQERIAPSWPLDQFIAVNPYWGWRAVPFASAAGQLSKLAGAPLTMPREYFLQEWEKGSFSQRDMQAAINLNDQPMSLEALQSCLQETQASVRRTLLVTELVDQQRDLTHAIPWQQFVKHQISQHCAAYFDQGQAKWHPDQAVNLYESWRTHSSYDQGPRLQLGFKKFHRTIQQLPVAALDLLRTALSGMAIKPQHWTDYLTAVLLDINGWAAWCAYHKWQAQLSHMHSEHLTELLAIRLAWEWVLYQHHPKVHTAFGQAWQQIDVSDDQVAAQSLADQLLLRSMEHAFQEPLARQLLQAQPVANSVSAVQAVFCIDVRSEVFRRALEASHADVETRGFAGFFGLPIAYRERGTALVRPQLPGLLAPTYWVSECDPGAGKGVRQTLLNKKRWQDLRLDASSGFTFVETLGLLYGAKLLKNNFGHSRNDERVQGDQPELMLYADSLLQNPVGLAEQATLLKQILTAMGLTQNFARLIVLTGHGAACTNNPHAASLDCGACGGQSGAVNVRLLAGMLNNPQLRKLLRQEQIDIPDRSWFIAGLHNTTTDHVQLFNLELVPQTHRNDLLQLQSALANASEMTRSERAGLLSLDHVAASESVFEQRAADWAQIRPEWGLANNAAFIVAPRDRTRSLNLQGRTFLHDYDWQNDAGYATLELIMTAPMIVTNWINMQYYASVVDSQHFGSGSKILHNVVGQRIGVFEGNGGDLRIGLPWQSVHDGNQWMHTPLRLSVFIAAPRTEIEAIIQKHAMLRELIDHQWLHLFQIDDQSNAIYCRNQQQWQLFQIDANR
ncbi:uncharacterized protein YbcC (UPF0753/DUF2309 family) [Oxalobacteraceae bacterium GrIS 2.11]